MRMVHGLRTLLSRLSLLILVMVSLQAKTLKVDTVTASVTNGNFTITPNGTGDILLSTFSGVLKASSGVVSVGDIDLASEITGVLPIANGGTNSSTALNNSFVMISTGGAIVEDSAVSTTELSYINGVTSAVQTQLGTKVATSGDESIAGVKSFTGELKAISTASPSVPAPVMTTVQRDALGGSAAGDQVFNSTTNQLNVYDGSSWVAVGAGGGGGLDVYHKEDFEGLIKATDFTTGTGGWLAGGTIDGTLADETSTPIAGLSSLKYTQGSSSVGDHAASPVITLDSKQKDNQSYVTLYYTHNGDDDDIKLVFYDVTNTNELDKGLVLVATTTKATRKSATFFVPSNATTLRYGFEVLVSNSGKILLIDDVEFSSKPITVVNTQDTQYAKYDTHGGMGSTNNKIPYFTNEQANDDNGAVNIDYNNSTSGMSITALRDCVVDATYTTRFNGGNTQAGFSLNSTQLTTAILNINTSDKLSYVNHAAGNVNYSVSVEVKMKTGDVLRPHTDGGSTSDSAKHTLVLTATVQNPSIVLASETSETTTKILSADVSSTGDISDLTFTGLDIGSLYNVSGMLNLGLASSDIIGAFRDTASAGGAILSGVNYNVSSATVNGTRWVSFQFRATTSNMYLNLSTAGGTVRGDGSRSESFIQLTNITSQFLTAIPTRKNQLDLVDGVAVPATDTSLGRVYIDSADGDLKIKFGDGTIKTIVTD